MAIARHPHWDTRHLNQFLLDRATAPFQWSVNDCCTFAADAILAYSGTDIAQEFRGLYDDERSAFVLIRKITGGSTVADAAAYCADRHGLVEHSHPLMAKRGDLVVMKNGDSLICGVVHLNGSEVVTVTETGIVRLPISCVVRSWGV